MTRILSTTGCSVISIDTNLLFSTHRQPSSMPLFSSPEPLHKLLDVMNTALQVQSSAVVLQATNALSSLLK